MRKQTAWLVFAGTSEGRQLAGFLKDHQIYAEICVATEYGEELLESETSEYVQVHTGRMDAAEMEHQIRERMSDGLKAVIDATHPHAVEVTANIRKACEAAGMRYVRLQRETLDLSEFDHIVSFATCQEAVDWLETQQGNILLTTGLKELPEITERISDTDRLYARVLPQAEAFTTAERIGLPKKQLICMQGPFSKNMNVTLLQETNASFLLTKESGAAGGFADKVQAAKEAGATCVVIRRPVQESGYSMQEVEQLILREEGQTETVLETDPDHSKKDKAQKTVQNESEMKKAEKPEITLLGIGMGTPETMTLEGFLTCEQADCIIGAKRMLEAVQESLKNWEICRKDAEQKSAEIIVQKQMVSMYLSTEIAEYIRTHSEYRHIVIALSGDVGFYSGAKKLTDALAEYPLHLICGISSGVYFAAKLQTSWDDMLLTSMHGRQMNLLAALKKSRKVFTLASDAKSIRELAELLLTYEMNEVSMSVGTNLSYPEEQITTGTPVDFQNYDSAGVSVVLLEKKEHAAPVITHGIPDEAFIRAKVPMTKEEVRSISLSKLQLCEDSIIYDVGAGTGSVSIEAARMADQGMVYAIEQKEEAAELIRENQKKFGVSNLQIIHGKAPEAFEGLPIPTHAFLGGTGGNMREIIGLLREKNPQIRIVVNCIALETLAEITALLQEWGILDADIASVNISKSKKLGQYHLMMGQNPVYVISFGGRKQGE
ncbi:precorrin-6A reductase [uncultured Eubacterium sp.]|uniref:precorrin-6A reductase n=1 Tax=uncultured Eubacterium sp. TaxID=165185 RepID=UPI0025E31175|nr:precorrin-6A reductase [uncultured Eubacterium sp.]